MSERIYINCDAVVDYRDEALIPFAERLNEELDNMTKSLDKAQEFWYDENYVRACTVTNRYIDCQTDFLENYAVALRNTNEMLEAYYTYLGRDFYERGFEMNDISHLNVGSPDTTIDTEPQALYDEGAAIYDYSSHLSEDMSRLYRNHLEMQDYWRGKQYDQFTDLMYEMNEAVKEYVANLEDISKRIGLLAIQISKAKGVVLNRNVVFEQHINMSL